MNELKDLISVIVPVYKVEAYIRKCIESIINQTYTNLEIILVDDGSPDGCPAILDEYAVKDKRIRVIHKKNGGLSSARNSGMEQASGKYIGFVDSDDYCDITMYEKLYKLMKEYDADITACGFYELCRHHKSTRYFSGKTYELNTETALDWLFDDRTFCNYAWNKLYKKEVFNGVKWDVGMTFEDIAAMHKVFANAKKVVYHVEPLYFYRYRKESITAEFNIKRTADFYKAITMREQSEEAVGREQLIDSNRLTFCIDIQRNKGKIHADKMREVFDMYDAMFKKIAFSKLNLKRKIGYIVIAKVPVLTRISLHAMYILRVFNRKYYFLKKEDR